MRKTLFLLVGTALLLLFIFRGFNPLELKMKAGLQVTTDGITSALFLNDQYLDKSPFIDKKIQPGAYTLRIHPDDPGFASYELPITLNKGTITGVIWKPGATLETSGGIVYEMEKLRDGDTQAEFQTVPDGAILTFDGGPKQFSPLLLADLSEGSHQFEVSLPSYETQQHSVNLIKGHKVTVTVILGKIGSQPLPESAETTQPDSEVEEITEGPAVQILATNFFVNGQEVLRVRTEASPAGAELGYAPVGTAYPYLDEITGWYQIRFQEQPGWVSAQYSQKISTGSAQPR